MPVTEHKYIVEFELNMASPGFPMGTGAAKREVESQTYMRLGLSSAPAGEVDLEVLLRRTDESDDVNKRGTTTYAISWAQMAMAIVSTARVAFVDERPIDVLYTVETETAVEIPGRWTGGETTMDEIQVNALEGITVRTASKNELVKASRDSGTTTKTRVKRRD